MFRAGSLTFALDYSCESRRINKEIEGDIRYFDVKYVQGGIADNCFRSFSRKSPYQQGD